MADLNVLKDALIETKDLIERMIEDKALGEEVLRLVDLSAHAFKSGKKILFCGNGGSAADAQHWAAELVSRFYYNRPALPAIALTTDTSILTAVGNDYGYERVFARQIEALGVEGDVLFALSTSGNSPSILEALKTAREKGVITAGFTGQGGGKMIDFCDLCIKIPSSCTPRIQEGHEILGHTICQMIEAEIFPES